jgi:hypothetical protein
MFLYTTLLTLSISVLGAPAAEPNPVLASDALVALAGEYLGGLNMNWACQVYYTWPKAYTWKSDDSCNAWTCQTQLSTGQIASAPVDLPAACANQYGNGVYAWCTKGAYDWGCYRA